MAMSHDQPDNGYRLTRLGVGAYVYPKAFTPDRVADALARLTSSPEVARACRACRARIEEQMPAEAVFRLLEEAHRTPAGDAPRDGERCRMEIVLSRCRLRPFREGDQPSIARYANNRRIWINLRDRFPHPYTLADADAWIRRGGRSGSADPMRGRGRGRRGRRYRSHAAGGRPPAVGGDRLLAGGAVLGARHHERGRAGVHRVRVRDLRCVSHLRDRLRVEPAPRPASWRRRDTSWRGGCARA